MDDPTVSACPPSPDPAEAALVAALRAGDENAYVSLVGRLQSSMLRVAAIHCPRRDAAEEVVQETWLAVFEGIGRFEGRSSLRTWIFTILANRAKSRGARERRMTPLSSIEGAGRPAGGADSDDGPTVDPDRFEAGQVPWKGHWTKPPRAWQFRPDDRTLAGELRRRIDEAIAGLPPTQREVITLHDVEGLPPEDVRNVLGLSATNQRVLLHRARARVRQTLEDYLDGGETG